MRIILPREIPGRDVMGTELIEAIKFVLEHKKIGDCAVELSETFRYEPGSAKKVLDSCEWTVWQTAPIMKGWFKKKLVYKKTYFLFRIPAIKIDQRYREFDISVEYWVGYRGTGYINIENQPNRFSNIEDLLDAFHREVSKKISAIQLSKT